MALVHHALHQDFGLPSATALTDIRTLAGGILALRFVCEASLTGLDRASLPPGPVPRAVNFVSRLNKDHHEVDVSLSPVLKWEKVE
jgi:hypothetical protein